MRRALLGGGGFAAGSIVLLVLYAAQTDAVLEYSASRQIPPMNTHTIQSEVSEKQPTSHVATPEPIQDESDWKRAVATIFWVGEDETSDNGFIHNRSSAWDVDWENHFGGVDDPIVRCGFQPCAFKPQENPFYVALPYNDLEKGARKENAVMIPWNDPRSRGSVLKNRWIAVRHNGLVCYGQWQDVGPFEEDDVAYVFGSASAPRNTHGMRAGIDLSPALGDCLGVQGAGTVEWRHIGTEVVPEGPWTETVTTSR